MRKKRKDGLDDRSCRDCSHWFSTVYDDAYCGLGKNMCDGPCDSWSGNGEQEAMVEPMLCFVDCPWAWFTTQELKEQWGDDWDDRPYQYNAGEPYRFSESDRNGGKKPWTIFKVAFDGPFVTPNDDNGNGNWSVEEINSGAVAWLHSDPFANGDRCISIPAGTTLDEFVSLVESGGGRTYMECGMRRKGRLPPMPEKE